MFILLNEYNSDSDDHLQQSFALAGSKAHKAYFQYDDVFFPINVRMVNGMEVKDLLIPVDLSISLFDIRCFCYVNSEWIDRWKLTQICLR